MTKPYPVPALFAGNTSRLSMRKVAAALGAVGLVAALVWALRPQPVQVDFGTVSVGPMRVTVDEDAKTRIKNLYVVSAPLTGRLRRSKLDPGDMVVKDETVIAVIEPAMPALLDTRTRNEAEAQVASARAAVALAEAELKQAETELGWAESEAQRARSLAQSNTVSTRAFERARLDVDKQKAAVARAKANLEVRRFDLATMAAHLIGPEMQGATPTSAFVEVRSPQSGTILRELQESERVVAAGSPLFEIGNPADMEVVAELLSSDAVRISPGAEASLEGAGLPGPVAARVRRIEPAAFTKVSALGIEEQRVRVLLDLQSPADVWARIGHEYRVFVRVTTWSGSDIVRVPPSALFRQGDQWAVYKIVGGRAVRTLIEIGHRSVDFAEVASGLGPGDQVVLHPGDRVVDRVRVVRRSAGQP